MSWRETRKCRKILAKAFVTGEVIQYLGEGAERLLRDRYALLLGGHETSREEQAESEEFDG